MTKVQEAEIIQRGLMMYWSCEVCKKLNWDKKCQDKKNCGERLYKLLDWHLKKQG